MGPNGKNINSLPYRPSQYSNRLFPLSQYRHAVDSFNNNLDRTIVAPGSSPQLMLQRAKFEEKLKSQVLRYSSSNPTHLLHTMLLDQYGNNPDNLNNSIDVRSTTGKIIGRGEHDQLGLHLYSLYDQFKRGGDKERNRHLEAITKQLIPLIKSHVDENPSMLFSEALRSLTTTVKKDYTFGGFGLNDDQIEELAGMAQVDGVSLPFQMSSTLSPQIVKHLINELTVTLNRHKEGYFHQLDSMVQGGDTSRANRWLDDSTRDFERDLQSRKGHQDGKKRSRQEAQNELDQLNEKQRQRWSADQYAPFSNKKTFQDDIKVKYRFKPTTIQTQERLLALLKHHHTLTSIFSPLRSTESMILPDINSQSTSPMLGGVNIESLLPPPPKVVIPIHNPGSFSLSHMNFDPTDDYHDEDLKLDLDEQRYGPNDQGENELERLYSTYLDEELKLVDDLLATIQGWVDETAVNDDPTVPHHVWKRYYYDKVAEREEQAKKNEVKREEYRQGRLAKYEQNLRRIDDQRRGLKARRQREFEYRNQGNVGDLDQGWFKSKMIKGLRWCKFRFNLAMDAILPHQLTIFGHTFGLDSDGNIATNRRSHDPDDNISQITIKTKPPHLAGFNIYTIIPRSEPEQRLIFASSLYAPGAGGTSNGRRIRGNNDNGNNLRDFGLVEDDLFFIDDDNGDDSGLFGQINSSHLSLDSGDTGNATWDNVARSTQSHLNNAMRGLQVSAHQQQQGRILRGIDPVTGRVTNDGSNSINSGYNQQFLNKFHFHYKYRNNGNSFVSSDYYALEFQHFIHVGSYKKEHHGDDGVKSLPGLPSLTRQLNTQTGQPLKFGLHDGCIDNVIESEVPYTYPLF